MKSEEQDYDFGEHCHRYACWVAARAASVSRFSNGQIASFIDDLQIKQEVEKLRKKKSLSHEIYKKWFEDIVTGMEKSMNLSQKAKTDRKKKLRNISFGIAAKVVSVYVKTYEIIPEKGISVLSTYAFPPIDSFLLKKLKAAGIIEIEKTNWSTFNKNEYFRIIEILRNNKSGFPFWMIEKNWEIK